MEEQITTILDLIPDMDVSDPRDCQAKAQAIREEFMESGRPSCTVDEIAFMMLLDHYIETLKRAKTLLSKDRFTVEYIGREKIPYLTDFRVINHKWKQEQKTP